MGVRTFLFGLLNRGTLPPVDPDATIVIADVPLPQGPMVVGALEANGIAASGFESYDLVSGVRSRMRIMVRQGDAAAAQAIVDEMTDANN